MTFLKKLTAVEAKSINWAYYYYWAFDIRCFEGGRRKGSGAQFSHFLTAGGSPTSDFSFPSYSLENGGLPKASKVQLSSSASKSWITALYVFPIGNSFLPISTISWLKETMYCYGGLRRLTLRNSLILLSTLAHSTCSTRNIHWDRAQLALN